MYIRLGLTSGFCSRIQTLLGYVYISDEEERNANCVRRKLVVYWPVNETCSCHFLDIFEPLDGVLFVCSPTEEAFSGGPVALWGQRNIAQIIQLHGISCNHIDIERIVTCLYKKLVLKPELQEVIDNFLSRVSLTDTIGLDLFQTSHENQQTLLNQSAEKFPSQQRFFLAMSDDSDETRKRFSAPFKKDQVVCFGPVLKDKRNQKSPPLVTIVVSMFLLAECRELLCASHESEFSEFVRRLRPARVSMPQGEQNKNFTPYPLSCPNHRYPRVTKDWSPALNAVWKGIKKRNVDPFQASFVHRPKAEICDDGVSEGLGYGMFVALYSNDQEYFNKIWDAGEVYMWNGQYHDWRVDKDGTRISLGAATDAEVDIALALIFADSLVRQGVWKKHASPGGCSYGAGAQRTINFTYKKLVSSQKYLKYANRPFFDKTINLGYFAPAYFRIFQEFEGSTRWTSVIEKNYQCLELNPGYKFGLVPDWMVVDGSLLHPTDKHDCPGYNSYNYGQSCFKDGIRIFWRLAADALWFKEERAVRFLQNALRFARQKAKDDGTAEHPNSPAHLANFYTMDGNPVPMEDTSNDLDGGSLFRSRNEHSHLTVGMWALAAVGVGDQNAMEAYSREMAEFYEGGTVFGKTHDSSGLNEDIAHNELYFDQFLAWFGVLGLNGNFCNIFS